MILIIKDSEIENLDDMSKLLFKIADSLGHPMKKIDIELTKTWGEQSKEAGK